MLRLQFSTEAGRVELSSDAASARPLQGLRGRFATSQSITSQTFDVEIDDLLVNLLRYAGCTMIVPIDRWIVTGVQYYRNNLQESRL